MEPTGGWVRQTFTWERADKLQLVNFDSPVAKWKHPMVYNRLTEKWTNTHGTPSHVLVAIVGTFQLFKY